MYIFRNFWVRYTPAQSMAEPQFGLGPKPHLHKLHLQLIRCFIGRALIKIQHICGQDNIRFSCGLYSLQFPVFILYSWPQSLQLFYVTGHCSTILHNRQHTVTNSIFIGDVVSYELHRYWPQTISATIISATQKTISAIGKVDIGHTISATNV